MASRLKPGRGPSGSRPLYCLRAALLSSPIRRRRLFAAPPRSNSPGPSIMRLAALLPTVLPQHGSWRGPPLVAGPTALSPGLSGPGPCALPVQSPWPRCSRPSLPARPFAVAV
jgi:hypothetical protein